MTPDNLKAIMPRANVALWTDPLNAAMGEFAINSPLREAGFLAQLAHESNQLTVTQENLHYSAEGLLKTWHNRFTAESATAYAKQPERIANYVYANRNGNGDESTGDGWLFRGRGPIQLTGRTNYVVAGSALALSLAQTPDLVLDPTIGARVAGWFWDLHQLNPKADTGDFVGITKAINGGLNGLDERLVYYETAKKVLGA